MSHFKLTEYTDTVPTLERKIDGHADTLEAFSALVRAHATTETRANSLIESAGNSLPTLPIGAGITAMPNDTHCITIHRLIGRR